MQVTNYAQTFDIFLRLIILKLQLQLCSQSGHSIENTDETSLISVLLRAIVQNPGFSLLDSVASKLKVNKFRS